MLELELFVTTKKRQQLLITKSAEYRISKSLYKYYYLAFIVEITAVMGILGLRIRIRKNNPYGSRIPIV